VRLSPWWLAVCASAGAACSGGAAADRDAGRDGDSSDVALVDVADARDSATGADTIGDASRERGWSYVPGRVAVLTQRNDNARSGSNLEETTLTTSNVAPQSFGRLFSRDVDDLIYAQPLYVPNVEIDGHGAHNVVYVATVAATVYAFDADYPEQTDPLWRQSFVDPAAGVVPVQMSDVGPPGYTDFVGKMGIVGTPVIDPSTGTLYVVAATREGATFHQRLHALDITSGAERPGSPHEIAASLPGSGEGQSVPGNIAFDPRIQNPRPGLLLSDGVVYVAWASFGDADSYHGWVMGFDAATLAPTAVFNSTPDGVRGGFWHSGQGLAADAAGDIWAVSSNGSFTADAAGRDYGNSVLHLRPTSGGALDVIDWFTPFDQMMLNDLDLDLGSSGVLLIPDGNLALAGGKNSALYLLDRGGLGHFSATDDGQIVQKVSLGAGEIHGLPVLWSGPNGAWVYVWAENDWLKAYALAGGRLSDAPAAENTALDAAPRPGAMFSLSADRAAAGSGILWTTHALEGSANWQTRPGVLRALDAADVTRELWNSLIVPSRDDLGTFAKFAPVTVADGKVFAATFSNQLCVYGLLGP